MKQQSCRQQYYRDQQVEQAVASFIDQHLYMKSKLSSDFHRWTDTKHQFAGIDFTFKGLNVDEKVKYHGCLNQVYQFPAFEVSFVNKSGYRQDGWFIDSTLSTDYYSIIGIYAYTSDESQMTCSNAISALDVLYIDKADVVDFVENYIPLSTLQQDAEALADTPPLFGSKSRRRYSHNKFWLTHSLALDEQPVNLVIPRQTLEALPHSKHIAVSREGVSKL